jgi:hypothetical protein
MTREFLMKNSFIIICLFILQTACSVQGGVAEQQGTLLGFNQLDDEISVGYRDLSVASPAPADDEVLGTP